MESKNQKARDNVVQVQADTINLGLTEETVRNIISIETQKTLKEAEIVATEVALKRLNEYNETLINKLVKYRREGKSIFYSLADDHVRTIINNAMEHILED